MRSRVRGTTSWLALAAVLTAAPCAGALDGPADGGDVAVAPDGSTPPRPGADGGDASTEPLADGGCGASCLPPDAGVPVAPSVERAGIFLSRDELLAVRAKVSAGAEPWKSAHAALLAEAGRALTKAPESVVDNGAGCAVADAHAFSTDAPSSGANRGDYTAATRMGQAVLALGLAYAFTEEARYADKAIALLDHWMVAPATRMNPVNRNVSPHTCGAAKQWAIEIMITVSAMIHGASLLDGYPGWDPADRQAVRAWIRAIGESAGAQDGGYYNNGENWRVLFEAAAAALLDDEAMLAHAFARYRNAFAGKLDAVHVDGQMNLDGSLRYETVRGTSLDYTNFALLPMIATAEIARHRGVDLYGFALADGRGLARGLDYAASATANPGEWPHKQSPSYAGEQSGLYELANLWSPKAVYANAVARWGRPVSTWVRAWVFGHPTLTHAAGAYPWKLLGGDDRAAP